ncbi:MAG: hypothetical protein HC767_13805 [Akkermansiaceae bacterium]|nr:hypothetical protein [Akkermansiaceae bacterium]
MVEFKHYLQGVGKLRLAPDFIDAAAEEHGSLRRGGAVSGHDLLHAYVNVVCWDRQNENKTPQKRRAHHEESAA